MAKHMQMRVILPILLLIVTTPACLPAAEDSDPTDMLVAMIKNSLTIEESLTAVLATRDKELQPLLEAMTQSGRSEIRGLAVTALPDILDKESVPLLIDRAFRFVADERSAAQLDAQAIEIQR